MRDLGKEEPICVRFAIATGQLLDQLATPGSISDEGLPDRQSHQTPTEATGLGPEDVEIGRPFEVCVENDPARLTKESGRKPHQRSGMGREEYFRWGQGSGEDA